MDTPRVRSRLVMLALLVLGLAGTSFASPTLAGPSATGGERFQIIVHPDNPVASVSRELVRDAFLKKTTEWGRGGTIRPIDLAARFPARARFTRDVLRKTPAQLKSYWNQQIFSGKGVPPPEAETAADVIAYVLANPGAIGYLPADVDPGRAKVVGIE